MDSYTVRHQAACALTVKLLDYPDAVLPSDAKGNPEEIAKTVVVLYNAILENIKA